VLLAEALEVIARLARQERYDRLQLQAAGTSVETHQKEVSYSIAARTRAIGALKTQAVWCGVTNRFRNWRLRFCG
jgi:hypothetical protein